MPHYSYSAYDIAGKRVRGMIQAADPAAVRASLRHDGMFVTSLSQDRSSTASSERLTIRRGVKLTDLVIFSQQLSTMIGAGMDLIDAFMVLAEQTENKRFKQVLVEISKEIQAGSSLSKAMSNYPSVFSEMYVALVRAGEVGGVLEETLLKGAQNLERELELREKVKTAFAYPLVVLVVACIVIAVMILFVVPVFSRVYEQFHAELPLITRTLVKVSYIATHYWWMVVLSVIALLFILRRYAKTYHGKRMLDRIKLRVPLLGKLSRKIVIARMIESLGTLVSAGVPLLEGLETSAKVGANTEYIDAVDRVVEHVKEGSRLSSEIKATGKFPSMVSRMIEVGEESGKLDEMMARVTAFYHRDIDSTVRRLLTLLEPALTVLLGVIVGFILLALYLPIFTLATIIKR